MKTSLVARIVLGCLIVAGACEARGQGLPPTESIGGLDRPVLIVASPRTQGFYRHAVLVVLPKGERHVGFIINRATRTTVASAFPEEPDSAKVAEPIYLGGPSGVQALYAVMRRDPGEGSRPLFGKVFLTGSGKTLDRIIRESPSEARYFAGFAVWDSGELAAEIARGDWLTAEPDEALLFHPNPEAMWPGLVERIRK